MSAVHTSPDATGSVVRPGGPSGIATGAPILTDVLRTHTRPLLVWSGVLVAIVALYTSVYVAFEDAGGMTAQLEALPPELSEALGYDQAVNAAGYVQSTVFELLGMVLLLVFTIGRGSRTLAGNEEDGSLELELSSAVSRTRVYVERSAAVLLVSLVLAIVTTGATAGMVLVLGLDVPVGDVLAAGLSLYLLVVATAATALAAGAITGRRAVALGAAAGISVLGYVAQAITPFLQGGDWLRDITPIGWHLGANVLTSGADPLRLAAMGVTAVVALVVGHAVFVRRDLGSA